MSPSENIWTDESDLTATGAVKATTSRWHAGGVSRCARACVSALCVRAGVVEGRRARAVGASSGLRERGGREESERAVRSVCVCAGGSWAGSG
eukprot:7388893-Prymnesium_polylepis.1